MKENASELRTEYRLERDENRSFISRLEILGLRDSSSYEMKQ